MILDIAMNITLNDRFKLLGVLNNNDQNKFSKSQLHVIYSLAYIIRSVIYSEYYKCNSSSNTEYIIDKLKSELDVLKAKSSFFSDWINRSLSRTHILLQKISVPNNPNYIRSV